MRFIWDERKNRSNLSKLGLIFTAAVFAFEDPHFITEQDREVDGEPRWQTIGIVNATTLVLVAHVDYEEETVCIISARKARPHERRRYEEGL